MTLEILNSFFSLFKILVTLAALVGLVGGGGVLGWYVGRRNYQQMKFKRWIVFEGASFRERGSKILVDFRSFGDVHDLQDVIRHPLLERRIIEATGGCSDGLMRVKETSDHLLMMGRIEDRLTGNDWEANMAVLKGRPTQDDEVAFCPTYFHGPDEGAMIRVLVFDSDKLAQLCDPSFTTRMVAAQSRYASRLQMLSNIGKEAAKALPRNKALVWKTVVETPVRQ